MLPWRDIGIKENVLDLDQEAQRHAGAYAQRVSQLEAGVAEFDQAAFAAAIVAQYTTFFDETRTTLRWSDVSIEKHRFDLEQSMRALFLGYKKPFFMTQEQIDHDVDEIGRAGQMEFDKRFSFFHALAVAIEFAEGIHLARDETATFLDTLMEGRALHDPLYLREILSHPQRLDFEGKRQIELFAQAIAANYRQQQCDDPRETNVRSMEDEATIARHFFETRPAKVTLPQKFVVHSVDGQAANKIWRTYEQVAERTASTLASIATYGIVSGGVVGGINPTTLMGTVDRADLCIINWYPEYQGAILAPLDAFAQPDYRCKFTHSMSVMVDGDKAHGTDIIVSQNSEGILPEVKPSGFVAIVPAALQERVSAEIYRLGHLLKRSDADVRDTLNRCIGYDPTRWKNIHYFNEWLQTTPEGTALLEERLGRKIADLPSMSEMRARPADST